MTESVAVRRGGTLVLLTLAAAQFLMTLDMSVMNVSIATVAKDVGTTVTGIQTAITLYTLVMAAFMITGGKIGAIMGRKRVFMIGFVIYGAGSLITALAHSLGVLILGWSVLEGLGAALIMPAVVALVATNFDPPDHPRVYGLIASAAAIAVAVGPLIGGLFTTYASWRWVFAGEVVIAVCLLALTTRLADTPPEKGVRLDPLGTLLSASGLVLVVYGILRVGTWGLVVPKADAPQWLGTSLCLWLILGGAIVLAGFVAMEAWRVKRGRAVLIDPAMLRIHRLQAGLISFFYQYLLQAGLFFVVPLFLSVALGLSPIATGVRLLPLSLALLCAAVAVPRLFRRTSPRRIVRIGFGLVFLGLLVLVLALDQGSGPEVVTVPLLLVGIGIGALASQLGAVTVSAVSEEKSGEVGGLQYTVTNLGASVGTALAGTVMISVLTTTFLFGLAGNPAVSQELNAKAQVEFSSGIPFVSDAQLESALHGAGVPPEEAQAIVSENAASRINGLRASIALLALIALLAVGMTRRLPDKPVGVDDAEVEPATEPEGAEPPPS